ncbi:MAG: hypothetical protein K6E10_01120 [Eubacterium sp.]|nr:hypothetical protein [Eubacterium sp.]
MPNSYSFPSKRNRRKLIEELKAKALQNGQDIDEDESYQKYIGLMNQLDEKMDNLYEYDEDGIPASLTQEDKDTLLELISKTAVAGEDFLANMGAKGKDIKKGLPGIVNNLQGLMARDFDALANYNPEEGYSLMEVQENARTLTINIGDKQLRTMGNKQNSRIPVTIRDNRGNVRNGVFTKINKNSPVADFNNIVEKVKAKCDPEAGKELDGIIGKYRQFLINYNGTTRNGEPIEENTPDEIILGRLNRELHNKAKKTDGVLSTSFIMEYFKESCGIKIDKLPSAAKELFADEINKNYVDGVGPDINSFNLEIPEGARIDNRNTCMSAVASLLGVSDLVARSDNMKYIDEHGNELEGTFMDFADGLDMDNNPDLQVYASKKPLGRLDKLMPRIADLQVLDFLCMNVDRHTGNLSYKVDKDGNIIDLQGFDNDSSFGDRDVKELDISKLVVVSSQMAEKLSKITPQMMKFALRGRGLSETEIDRAGERLVKLKDAIENKKLMVRNSEEMANSKLADYINENPRNLFCRIGEFGGEIIKNKKNSMIQHIPYDPDNAARKVTFSKVSATERLGTIGGIEDTLRNVSVVTSRDGDELLSSWRGASPEFKALKTQGDMMYNYYLALYRNKKIDKRMQFFEPEAQKITEESLELFNQLDSKAKEYLNFKMKERRVKSLDKLVGKNEYEQRHIDYAKDMLKATKEFLKNIQRPENEKENQLKADTNARRKIDKKRAEKKIKEPGKK